jgi:HEAT repeat protein
VNTRKTPFALSPPEQRRVDAVDRLAAIGEAGLPELLEMLSDRSWTVRRAVVSSLAAMGDTATGPLCALLRTARDDEARISAVMDALASSLGDPLPCLVELLDDRNPAPVADAAIILGRRREPAAVPVLVGLIEHADDNVAVAAIEALGRIGGRTAVDALIKVVATRRFFRVFPAMDVLGRSR